MPRTKATKPNAPKPKAPKPKAPKPKAPKPKAPKPKAAFKSKAAPKPKAAPKKPKAASKPKEKSKKENELKAHAQMTEDLRSLRYKWEDFSSSPKREMQHRSPSIEVVIRRRGPQTIVFEAKKPNVVTHRCAQSYTQQMDFQKFLQKLRESFITD